MIVLIIIITVFEIYLVMRVLKFFLLSPTYIYIIFSLVSIALSLWYFYFFKEKFSLFNFDKVSEKTFLNTIKLYVLTLDSFLLGVIVFYESSKKKTKFIFNKSFTESLFIKYNFPNYLKNVVIIIFFTVLILYFITYGKGVFIRSEYLPDTNRFFTIFIKVLTFIEVIILGLIYSKHKMLSTFLFLLTIFLSISTGSRSVFLFYVFFVCLMFISNGNNIKNKLRFSIHLAIGFVFLSFMMQLRSLDSHGLIPYIKSIGSSSESFSRSFFFNLYYSFIYGVYVTIATVKKAQLDWNIIFININPMPGSIAGWYDYADKMRLNIYAPYSLHGRVFKMGYLFTIIYFFLTGLLFSYFEKVVRFKFDKNKRITAFLIVILLALHIVYAFEYNMRAAIRYFYYALFIIFMGYLIRQVKINLPKIKKE